MFAPWKAHGEERDDNQNPTAEDAMSPPSTSPFSRAFDAKVAAFRTRDFTLSEDLDWLGRLRKIRAAVAVTLHGNRDSRSVGEAQARARILLLPKKPGETPNLNDILVGLWKAGSLSPETLRLLHELRGLGNDGRHASGEVTWNAARHGYAIIIRGMQWFFCEIPDGCD